MVLTEQKATTIYLGFEPQFLDVLLSSMLAPKLLIILQTQQ